MNTATPIITGGMWVIVIHVAQTPTEMWVLLRNPCVSPIVTVWLRAIGHPRFGEMVFLDHATIAQAIPYDGDATAVPLNGLAMLPSFNGTEATATSLTVASVVRPAPDPTTGADQPTAQASPTDAEVEAELDAIRACLRGGHEANLRRQLAWVGIADGEILALQSLGPSRKDLAYLAFARSVDEAVRLSSPAGLAAPNRFGKIEPFAYQGIYGIFNKLVGRIDEVFAPGAWAPMPEGLITDKRIRARRFLYLDLDTVRLDFDGLPVELPISSTKEELRSTIARSVVVRNDLVRTLERAGIDRPADVVATQMSGNGTQLHLALDDIPEGPDVHEPVHELLAIWSVLFDSPCSHVDVSVHDAKRIAPLAGTIKRKGVLTKLHRMVTFTGSASPRRLTLAELHALAICYFERLTEEQRGLVAKLLGVHPARAPQPPYSGGARPGGGLDACNLVPIREVASKLGIDHEKPVCPGCQRSGSAVAFLDDRNTLHCSFDTCEKAGQKSRRPADLVALVAFRCGSIRGSKGVVPQVLAWFKQHFGVVA